MKPQRSIEYLVGFIMGFFIGFGLNGCLYIYNLFCKFLEWTPIEIVWWMLVPLPLLCGLGMAITIANFHLEDY